MNTMIVMKRTIKMVTQTGTRILMRSNDMLSSSSFFLLLELDPS